MDYRTKLKRALEKAHMAAMKTGGKFDKAASEKVTAGVICRHFGGKDFGKLLIFTQGKDAEVTGGVLYLPGWKLTVHGSTKREVRQRMAAKVCGLEAYFTGKEIADGESV